MTLLEETNARLEETNACVRARQRAKACWISMSGSREGLTARPSPRTVRTGCPAYSSRIGKRIRGRPRMASETSGWVMPPVAGSRRTTMLVLPPAQVRI